MTNEEMKIIELISKISIDRASQVFSKILKAGSRIEIVNFRKVDISRISEEISIADEEVSGAIVQLSGDTPTKLLFIVNLKDVFTLTDLFLRKEIGTTKNFDIYSESTIQEIGNIMASSITNVFVTDFDVELYPEPPIVVNDYSSSIFNSILMDDDYNKSNEILLIETKFFIVKTSIDCTLFILPTNESTNILLKKYNSMNL